LATSDQFEQKRVIFVLALFIGHFWKRSVFVRAYWSGNGNSQIFAGGLSEKKRVIV
jgi:hypothetical protein